MAIQTCRVCRCTELNACFKVVASIVRPVEGAVIVQGVTRTEACHWAEDDLCSMCVDVKVIDNLEVRSISIDSSPNAFGEGLMVVSEPKQVTHMVCTESPHGDTHHLRPARTGSNSQGEPVYTPRCEYCGRSRSQILEEEP